MIIKSTQLRQVYVLVMDEEQAKKAYLILNTYAKDSIPLSKITQKGVKLIINLEGILHASDTPISLFVEAGYTSISYKDLIEKF